MDMVTLSTSSITSMAKITRTYHIWCPCTPLEGKEEHKLKATCGCETNQIAKKNWFGILRFDNRRVTIRSGNVHGYTPSRILFRRCGSQTDMWRTAHTSVILRFNAGLKNHCNKTSDADLPYLNATVTTSTTTKWHLCMCAMTHTVAWQYDVTSNKQNWWCLDDPECAARVCLRVLRIFVSMFTFRHNLQFKTVDLLSFSNMCRNMRCLRFFSFFYDLFS